MANPIELTQEDYLNIIDLADDEIDQDDFEEFGDEYCESMRKLSRWAAFEAGVEESVSSESVEESIEQRRDELETTDEA
jgi:hypothetical protein